MEERCIICNNKYHIILRGEAQCYNCFFKSNPKVKFVIDDIPDEKKSSYNAEVHYLSEDVLYIIIVTRHTISNEEISIIYHIRGSELPTKMKSWLDEEQYLINSYPEEIFEKRGSQSSTWKTISYKLECYSHYHNYLLYDYDTLNGNSGEILLIANKVFHKKIILLSDDPSKTKNLTFDELIVYIK